MELKQKESRNHENFLHVLKLEPFVAEAPKLYDIFVFQFSHLVVSKQEWWLNIIQIIFKT